MFERTKKDEAGADDFAPRKSESDKSFSASRGTASGRGQEAAVIGRSIQIYGDLRGGEDLRIEGDVTGTVELINSALTIGKEGKVKADVYAKSIAVDGETRGDLYASERVSVHLNARVQGNIVAPRVSIEEGAHFKGSIEMDAKAVEKALGKAGIEPKENQPTRASAAKTDTGGKDKVSAVASSG